MKRKTFIKQAMGAGLKRNAAELAAQDARRRGEPYIFASGRLLNFHAMLINYTRKAVMDALLYGQGAVNVGEALSFFYPWLLESPDHIAAGNIQAVIKTEHNAVPLGMHPLTSIKDKICPGGGTQ